MKLGPEGLHYMLRRVQFSSVQFSSVQMASLVVPLFLTPLAQAIGMSKCSVRTNINVHRRALSMQLGHGVLGHEPLSVCEVA